MPIAARLTERIDALRRRCASFRRWRSVWRRRPIGRSRSPIRMQGRWPRTVRGRDWSATTCRRQSTPDSHIVVAHEVTNLGHDRTQLASMRRAGERRGRRRGSDGARRPRLLLRRRGSRLRGLGVTPICPKPLTSGARAEGRFGKPDFIYQPDSDTYSARQARRCRSVRPASSMAWCFTATGRATAGDASSSRTAQPEASGASRAGSTSTSSRPCRTGSTACPKPCGSGAERSSTSSARSRTGWAAHTSRREGSETSRPR